MRKILATIALGCALALGTAASASANPCPLAEKAAAVQSAIMGLQTAEKEDAIYTGRDEIMKLAALLPPSVSLGPNELVHATDEIARAVMAKEFGQARRLVIRLYQEFDAETVCAAAK